MTNLRRGIYEQLVTEAIQRELSALDGSLAAVRESLDPVEAADRLAFYLSAVVRRAIEGFETRDRSKAGVRLAQQIVNLLVSQSRNVDASDAPSDVGSVLRSIVAHLPDGSPQNIPLPATPLLDTTLLTNAPGEPRIGFQIQSEIPSADRIDLLMAFVRQTGTRPLLELLKAHTANGKTLRILTTTYTGSTELSALESLRDSGAQIRVSYDTSSTRLHAKAWLFHRATGFSTAFVGSSNLTHSAQVSGLEWNVRLSGARNPDVIDKFTAIFESYWNNDEFRVFDTQEFRELAQLPSHGPRVFLSPVEVRPEPFQSRLLEQIELARMQGRHRNLLVSATGTGKTVMAALDFQRLKARLPRSRLLFVAHRKEIIDQSIATFRHALRDASFGEAWVAGDRPVRFEHVFASIQSLSASGIENIDPHHFDVVVVDEFHHAAASTYAALLARLEPSELLGLTATPERGDDQPILHWFGDKITAELRLWDAIDQHKLVPFSYYGISDGKDYRNVAWRRGRGYDLLELEGLLTGDHALARLVVKKVKETAPNPSEMRALGFCVSVRHAQFMASQFTSHGLPSVAICGDTPSDERKKALDDLERGAIRAIFSVDIFNEGIDIPPVDTLLFLRPTDSTTIFLQQLGRGLRRHKGKSICTVLDFVGQHRSEFRLYKRYAAILGVGRRELAKQVEAGFPFLPSGCEMSLDAVAATTVLNNIRESLPNTMPGRAAELLRVADGANEITLQKFLDATGLELEDIYSNGHSWSDLVEAGRLAVLPPGPDERSLRKALGRLLHVDDPVRIRAYRNLAGLDSSPQIGSMNVLERRVFHMLVAVLMEKVAITDNSLSAAAVHLWRHPQVLRELGQLMDVLFQRMSHVPVPLATHPEVPMAIHARYTRREILAAFSDGISLDLPAWREGTRWIEAENVDLLAVTINKTGDRFSPTTRYRDYAISADLFHWESQSTTSAGSRTGVRYQNHASLGSSVLLFARLTTDDRSFWLLGPSTYVSHENERPMAIKWLLTEPLSGDLLTAFAAAVS